MAEKRPVLNDAELSTQRGFGLRIGFGGRPALIIDMANAFADDTAMLGLISMSRSPRAGPILEAAHARNIPVFFSTVRYEDHEMKDIGIWLQRNRDCVR